MDTPGLLVSAAHKSSGKTTLSIGIAAALSARGLAVQPFKKGPDYIDPMWLGAAAGRACRNLDFFVMGREEIVAQLATHAADADVALIEGNKGLYDGLDLEGSNSNAALAALAGVPVVLVIDARGMTRGIAPLILGFQAFDRSIRIAGVILNRLGGPRHEAKLRAVIEHYTDVRVVGAVHQDPRIEIVERHLGLMPSSESAESAARIAAIRDAVAGQVDLDTLLAIAGWRAGARAPIPRAKPAATPPAPTLRVGVALDRAFGFYYPDDLESLAQAGAEIVPVNTLADAKLPEIDALVIGGGFPEVLMAELEANASLRADIRRAAEAGLPIYAECGGLMYLGRSLTWRGETRRMAGVIPGDVVMHDKPVGRGYVRLRETARHPWPLGDGGEVRAHEFHYSSLENVVPHVEFAYDVTRGHGADGAHDGVVIGNVVASYAHLRSVGGNAWTRRFVAFAHKVKAERLARDAARRAAKRERTGEGAVAQGRSEALVIPAQAGIQPEPAQELAGSPLSRG
ncbi:MAG: cobyrinate a,c-diamide synthase [Burkholderiales bacterium]|nr:cobyrinate a,c-diamide synthase [Burkholderiales bacterium]